MLTPKSVFVPVFSSLGNLFRSSGSTRSIAVFSRPLALSLWLLSAVASSAKVEEWKVLNPDNIQQTSAHFAVRWDKNLNLKISPDELKQGLDRLEKIYALYTEKIGFQAPYHDQTVKYKITINLSDKGWANGGGTGKRDPAMWLHFNAFKDSHALAHEFAHSLQFASLGLRDSPYSGWFWESHAEWMAHQFEPEDIHNGHQLVDNPHLYYGSTRNRYGNWLFWEFLKDKYGYGVVNDLWRKIPGGKNALNPNDSPLGILMSNQKWTSGDLADRMGEFAMHNVNWDYRNGEVYRKELSLDEDRTGRACFRTTWLQPVAGKAGVYVVPNYHAPQQYGYNLVRILPDPQAGTLKVRFRGQVQREAAVTSFPSKNEFLPRKVSPPNSDWRWGIVLIDAQGRSTCSPLQRGPEGELNLNTTGAAQVWLVVSATPKAYQKILWDQMYYSIYRYPWSVQITGGFPFGAGPVAAPADRKGAPHPNGGGWVEQTARVDATAYVGPEARVMDRAKILGSARILDRAEVSGDAVVQDQAIVRDRALVSRKARVSGNAKIMDEAIILEGLVTGRAQVGAMTVVNGPKARIADDAVVRTVMNDINEFSITGTAQFLGDGELHTSLSKGVFYGIVLPETATDSSMGATRTSPVPEVTGR